MAWWLILLIIIGVFLIGVTIFDLTQKQRAILRNFPIIGHLRYILESVGPELRQYIVTDNDEERPFNRDQRRFVYATSKKANPYFGFGTDNNIDSEGYLIVKQAPFPIAAPLPEGSPIPSAKVLGGWRDRPGKFRPESIVTVSAMSFGSLSGPAVEAINRGCEMSGALHNTGEGGVSDHHRHGAGLIYQIGTGYFGARNPDGSLNIDRLAESAQSANVRAIEVKLSQGAKPGLGGVLPGKKVTAAIAEARGVEIGKTVYSPNAHSAFHDVDSMIDVIEQIADATGLPVGVKSAVGQEAVWGELAERMRVRGEGPDFIAIDGGEGGTGAAPLTFSDHVALPFRIGFARVYKQFLEADMHQNVTFVGSGKLGFGAEAMLAIGLGCDMIALAREVMLAVGCIQAQECHTGHCPTGVATQHKWLIRGLDPTDKSARVANYLTGFREDLLKLSYACGSSHPALVPQDAVEIVKQKGESESLGLHYCYPPNVQRLSAEQVATVTDLTAIRAGV